MRKYLQFCTAFILCIFLTCCKEQKRKDQLKNSINHTTGELFDSSTSIKEIDTLFMPNAPSRITRKIRKDKEGNLLIAAFSDVMWYDGKSFSKIPKPEGFESFDAFDALEDSKGNIWIASTHYGVFRYDGKNFTHLTTDDGLGSNRTMDIHEDKAGNIWIATMGGASCYNGNSIQNYTTKEGMTHNDVNTIMEDRSGKIWFGTRGTACFYDPSSSIFTEITNNESEPLRNVRSMIEDNDGTIWLSGEKGIWRYGKSLLIRVSNQGGNYIYEDKNANIWFTNGCVLSFFNKESLNLNNPKVTDIYVGEGMFFGISEDKEGNIWVGTLQGIFIYYGKSIHYYNDVKS